MNDVPAIPPAPSAQATDSARQAPLAQIAPWALGWSLFWLGTFGAFHLVLVPAGYGHYERSLGGGLHYFGMACLRMLIFRRELRRPGTPGVIGWGPPLALVGVGALALAVCGWVQSIPLGEEAAARFQALQMGVARLPFPALFGRELHVDPHDAGLEHPPTLVPGCVGADRVDLVQGGHDLVGSGLEVCVTHLALFCPRKLLLGCLELLGQVADLRRELPCCGALREGLR